MKADIGIIGGSGFYSLLENAKEIDADTVYGRPSGRISVGRIEGKSVAFLPRHGSRHSIPPHKVPYRANIQALYDLGVRRIIATNATGSLNPKFKVGQIVAFDQFANFTNGRVDTFFEDRVAHVGMAEPYCSELRSIATKAAKRKSLDFRDRGSVLVINGPRFSTRAESLFFSRQGFDLINMTQYPEAALARERCMCYLALGIVTDYDVGLEGRKDIKPVSHSEVVATFSKNIGKVKWLVGEMVKGTPEARKCSCQNALDGATVKV
ncbi:MAG: S-methyl-5'-thioadenosine phosphorylase [Candidatus Micrarchaeaceae archaeon]|jgi:5'-methylthioadenosine phosphorylase|nr:S-methyl-5'-thioadenosine phosphorylase [Candidatus Micrarchaeota archaeon]HII10136.1 S-methyl-5'-thioadenosine phosphorylase [Candidatus Micrarchaeota archaeon]